jgi:hypothetical protein
MHEARKEGGIEVQPLGLQFPTLNKVLTSDQNVNKEEMEHMLPQQT